MHYALDGATGFIGGAVARVLRNRGDQVSALVRETGRPQSDSSPVDGGKIARADDLRAIGVRIVPGDLADVGALRRLLTGVDGFFHIAGWYQLGDSAKARADAVRVNVEGTRAALGAAVTAGVPRIVHTSTLAVNSDTQGIVVDEGYRYTGPFLSPYEETKAAAHDIAVGFARQGAPVVIVMPGLVYGPDDAGPTGQLLTDVIRGRRPVVPDGGQLCWAHVDDIAAGHVAAMDRGRVGEAYVLAGPRLSLAEGLRALATIAGTRGPIVVPARAVATVATVSRSVARLVPLPALYTASSLRSSLATYLGTSAKAQAELGWHARPVSDGLQQVVAAERQRRRQPETDPAR